MRIWLVASIVVAVLAGVWLGVKPVRLLLPCFNGVRCAGQVCTDDPSRYAEAARLYAQALRDVASEVAPIARPPRAVFCATQACFESFGFGRSAAETVGTFGIVVAPRGWAPHYVRHELIHHLQNERLGNLRARLVTPRWFIEGMAYALSRDPRPQLSEPWESYRTRFEAWRRGVGPGRFWAEAAKL